jgi:alpha-tubulin suppressor-like RCC1 family protein
MDISFGFKHALVLLDNGKVYSWGDGTYGELGLGKACMVPEPREIKYFAREKIRAVKVEAASRHSLVLDAKGHIYGFGFGSSRDRFEVRSSVPKLVESVRFKLIDIYVGDSHSVGVSSGGVPFMWHGSDGEPHEIEEVGGRLMLDIVLGATNTIIIT